MKAIVCWVTKNAGIATRKNWTSFNHIAFFFFRLVGYFKCFCLQSTIWLLNKNLSLPPPNRRHILKEKEQTWFTLPHQVGRWACGDGRDPAVARTQPEIVFFFYFRKKEKALIFTTTILLQHCTASVCILYIAYVLYLDDEGVVKWSGVGFAAGHSFLSRSSFSFRRRIDGLRHRNWPIILSLSWVYNTWWVKQFS